MSSEKKIDPFAVIILVLSIIGIILVATQDFAGFYLGGGYYRYSCLDCEYATGVDLAAQIIILILLIVQIVIALNDLLPNRFIEKNLDLIGLILGGLTILFTMIGLGAFGIVYGFFGDHDWWPETGFYGAIIAGILNTILFFLKFKNR